MDGICLRKPLCSGPERAWVIAARDDPTNDWVLLLIEPQARRYNGDRPARDPCATQLHLKQSAHLT
jgi:hypothetical protein